MKRKIKIVIVLLLGIVVLVPLGVRGLFWLSYQEKEITKLNETMIENLEIYGGVPPVVEFGGMVKKC